MKVDIVCEKSSAMPSKLRASSACILTSCQPPRKKYLLQGERPCLERYRWQKIERLGCEIFSARVSTPGTAAVVKGDGIWNI